MTIGEVNRLSRRVASGQWGMLLISVCFFSVFLSPFLFGHRIFFNADFVAYHYPIYHFYQDSLDNGESVFWNPNNFSGFPSFLGSMGFLSPLHYLVFKIFPLFIAYNLIVFLGAALALFFAWRFCRELKLSNSISFLCGLIYVFSQWSWISDIAVSTALPFLPALFLILLLIKKKEKTAMLVALGGLLIGWGWLAVHFSWLVMALTAGFFYALYLGWSCSKKWLILFNFLLMVFLGTCVGLLIILPLFGHSSLSARSAGLSYQEAAIGSLKPGDFLRYFLPYFRASLFSLANAPAQLYIGILPLFFLMLGLGLKRKTRFFSFLFTLSLFTAIAYSPLFWILHQLPIFNSFRSPHRWMYIGSFAAAILAGFGIEDFMARLNGRRASVLLRVLKWISSSVVFVLITSTLVFRAFGSEFVSVAQDYFDKYFYVETTGLPLEHYHNFIEKNFIEMQDILDLANPLVLLPVIFMVVSCLAIRYLLVRRQYSVQIIIPIVLMNCVTIFGLYHPTLSREDFSYQPQTAGFIKEQSVLQNQTGRTFSFLPGFSQYSKLTVPFQAGEKASFIFQSEMLAPNLNLLYGLESADYYDNLMSRRMSRILSLIGSDRATIGEKLPELEISSEEKIEVFKERKHLLDLLGVRYVISTFDLGGGELKKVFEGEIPPYGIPIYVYENPEARPLLYFAESVKFIEPDETAAYELLRDAAWAGRKIFVECYNRTGKQDVNDSGLIMAKEEENAFVRLQTNSAGDGWLVFSQNHLPGWRAYLDRKKIEICTVNSVYMGIYVPAGEHEVIFEYEPYGFVL